MTMQADRYPISALEVEGLPVWFTLGDQEVLGFVKFTRSGRPVYRVGTARKSDDLPKFARPALWRPVNVETWPEALPEPATVQKPVAWVETKPKPESLPDPAVRDVDRWPYPHVTLGRADERPKTVDAAKALAPGIASHRAAGGRIDLVAVRQHVAQERLRMRKCEAPGYDPELDEDDWEHKMRSHCMRATKAFGEALRQEIEA